EATALGGREGQVSSPDGYLDVDLAVPKELGGPGGSTNPEELFAAGYAGCFHSAMKAVGRSTKADLDGSSVTARVGIGPNDAGGFGLAVELDVRAPKMDPADAEALIEQAHQV